jgi:uncharacterized protein
MNKLALTHTEYQKMAMTLCRDIAADNWYPDYIVGITRGGLIPAVMISHFFNVPMYALSVNLRDFENYESNLWMPEDAFGYVPKNQQGTMDIVSDAATRKKILIVDDINDTGATINWIVKDWESSCLPNAQDVWKEVWGENVRTAVIINNNSANSVIKPKYIGQTIDKSVEDIWVEFPYENWWKR